MDPRKRPGVRERMLRRARKVQGCGNRDKRWQIPRIDPKSRPRISVAEITAQISPR